MGTLWKKSLLVWFRVAGSHASRASMMTTKMTINNDWWWWGEFLNSSEFDLNKIAIIATTWLPNSGCHVISTKLKPNQTFEITYIYAADRKLPETRNSEIIPKSGALVRTFHWTALVWGWVNIWSTDHLSEHRNIWSSELTSDSEIGWTSKWTSGLLNELMWLGMKIIKVDEKSDSSRATMNEHRIVRTFAGGYLIGRLC